MVSSPSRPTTRSGLGDVRRRGAPAARRRPASSSAASLSAAGERAKDASHLLQSAKVQKPPGLQGDAVQGRQGLARRAGCAPPLLPANSPLVGARLLPRAAAGSAPCGTAGEGAPSTESSLARPQGSGGTTTSRRASAGRPSPSSTRRRVRTRWQGKGGGAAAARRGGREGSAQRCGVEAAVGAAQWGHAAVP